MDGYASKPVEPEELFAAIERIGDDRRGQDGAGGAIDREAIVRRLGGDADLLLETVRTFSEESAELLREIRRSIAAGDAAQLASAAHSLKGALGTLTASAASDAAKQLEVMAREGDLSRAEEGRRVLERAMVAVRRELAALVS